MAKEVDCPRHGTFEYSEDVCLRCTLDADPRRIEELQRLADEQEEAAFALVQNKKICLDEISEKYGVTHRIGAAGDVYEGYQLLGAIDICGRRYARITLPSKVYAKESDVICVPWIDAFAECLEEFITIRWLIKETAYSVSDDDGEISVRESEESIPSPVEDDDASLKGECDASGDDVSD